MPGWAALHGRAIDQSQPHESRSALDSAGQSGRRGKPIRGPSASMQCFPGAVCRCILSEVRPGPKSFILYAVLVFQLAVGMHLPIAQAIASASDGPAAQVIGSSAPACPEHAAKVATPRAAHVSAVTGSGAHAQQSPLNRHSCCNSVGCQCHCSYTPVAPDLTAFSTVVGFSYLIPASEPRIASTRLHELFRPPIA